MKSPLTLASLRRRADAGLIVGFFIFIWLPIADTFLRLDRTPAPNENRAPARFPKFKPDFAAMRQFVSGLEAYFGDHFGFRNRLVVWEHHWKWQWFRTSKINYVLLGKSGWLFYGGGWMIEDVMANRPFTQKELEAWRDLIQGRRDWLAQRGIRYLFVVPPDKHTIYQENLPDWLAGVARSPHRLDQFMSYMKTHTDLPVLDLRQPLLEAKMNGLIYHQTDTHWNEMGAYIGYRSIVEHAAALGLNIKPLDLSAFRVSTADSASGDLARMLGQQDSMRETAQVFVTPKPPLPVLTAPVEPKLLVKNWVPGDEPRLSENPAVGGRLVIFRDSFAINLSQFLGYSFGRIAYIWQQNWDKRIIESEKPDLVVDEMLERFLIARDPMELKKADEQPDAQIFADR